jgi:7-cyano-7-deazaguanine synthase
LNLEQAYESNWSRTGLTPAADSEDSDVFLPARNLLLTTKSMLVLSPEGVFDMALAVLRGNPFPDARLPYFRLLEKVLRGGFKHPVRIHTPFRNMTKAQVIRSVSDYPLHLTLSCISPRNGGHCGQCNKCAERKRAFQEAGVRDRTRYESGPRPQEPRPAAIKRSS